jgi:hypothetical protein
MLRGNKSIGAGRRETADARIETDGRWRSAARRFAAQRNLIKLPPPLRSAAAAAALECGRQRATRFCRFARFNARAAALTLNASAPLENAKRGREERCAARET